MHAWQNFGFRHTLIAMVALSASISESAAVSSSASAGSLIVPSVAVSRSNGEPNSLVAPLAVHFDATGTTAPLYTARPFHDFEYRWDFDDGTGTPWARGSRAGAELKNTAFGPVSAHVFESAGVYTPKLYVRFRKTDGSFDNAAVYSCPTLTVISADAAWPTTQTICYSETGDFTGAPADCVQVTVAGTTNDAVTKFNTNKVGGNKRHMWRAGETFSLSGSLPADVAGPSMFCSFGSGAKPKFLATNTTAMIALSSSSTPTGVSDWRFQDIELDGALQASSFNGAGGISKVLIHRVDMKNVGYGLLLSGSNLLGLNAGSPLLHPMWDEFYIVDSTFDNLIPGGGPNSVFANGHRMVLMGNLVNNQLGGEHGFRFQLANRAVISHNTISGIAAGKTNLTLRGCNFAGDNSVVAGTYSEKNVISYNDFVSGDSAGMMGIGPQNSNFDERGRDMIVECNLYRGSAVTINTITCAQPDITFRFNVALLFAGLFCKIEKSALVPVPTNVNFHSNTVYSSGAGGFTFVDCSPNTTGGSPAGEDTPLGTVTGELRNNLVFAPNATSYQVMFQNLYGTGAFTLSNNTTNGQLQATAPPFTTQPPTTIAHTKPISGYAVGGGGTGANRVHGRYSDILGVAIPSISDIGAVAA